MPSDWIHSSRANVANGQLNYKNSTNYKIGEATYAGQATGTISPTNTSPKTTFALARPV